MDITLTLMGVVSGLLIGLTGVGGGAIMTPLLISVGVPPVTAVGTDLWFAAVTKSVSTGYGHNSGLVDWKITKRLWLGSLPASFIVLLLMVVAPLEGVSVLFLERSVAAMVLITAVGLAFKSLLHSTGRGLRVSNEIGFKAVQRPLTIFSGILLGSVVTLTSVGAGALGVVVLSYLYPLRMTTRRLVSTDIAHAIPLAFFAGFGHALAGNVDLKLLFNILAGSIPAVLVASALASRIPDSILRYGLAAVLLVVGMRLLFLSLYGV